MLSRDDTYRAKQDHARPPIQWLASGTVARYQRKDVQTTSVVDRAFELYMTWAIKPDFVSVDPLDGLHLVFVRSHMVLVELQRLRKRHVLPHDLIRMVAEYYFRNRSALTLLDNRPLSLIDLCGPDGWLIFLRNGRVAINRGLEDQHSLFTASWQDQDPGGYMYSDFDEQLAYVSQEDGRTPYLSQEYLKSLVSAAWLTS